MIFLQHIRAGMVKAEHLPIKVAGVCNIFLITLVPFTTEVLVFTFQLLFLLVIFVLIDLFELI